MNKIYKLSLITILFFFIAEQTQAQYATKKFKSKHEAYTDSIKNVDYNYVFPILGKATYKRGFDIPYPMGIMVNYIWMDQGIDITNMQLGLTTVNRDIPLTPVDFIDFGENRNTSMSFNVRPDVWIFPFLNVYGLFGYGKSKTEVNLVAPVELKSVVEQNISTAGFGVMGAFGVGPVWVSIDGNWTWNKPELLDDPVRVNVMGLRIGHTFVFKNKPESNIAIWAGGMRVKMSSETRGAISMADAFPDETWDRGEEIGEQYDEWYDGLTPAKKVIVDNTPVPDIVDKIRNNDRDGSSTIKYGMDKQASQMWNGIIGMQYQVNKHWQFRTEGGIIGDRKSFLFSVNYRFLGFKSKH